MKRSEKIARHIPDIRPQSYHSAKIRAYAAAYGHRYPNVACSIYSGCGICALIYNSDMVICGRPHDEETFRSFADTFGEGKTIESGTLLPLDGWTRTDTSHMRGRVTGDDDGVRPADIYRMSAYIETVFGVPRDMWYTDMSHRVRHRISRVYECGGSYAAVDFQSFGTAYVSAVMSPGESGGRGNIRRILSRISRNYIIDLRCGSELVGLYEHLGLRRSGTHFMYHDRKL
ncbi:MAG: hypothetical protein IJ080_02460 [Oscillospiraceae bacterium]|nr:hypothetical protein [Oscillospiraceae bacterium]MBQ8978607.1 hypothetical protein [Oscillospiraceae bacterium]